MNNSDNIYYDLFQSIVVARSKMVGFYGKKYIDILKLSKKESIKWSRENLYPILENEDEIIKRDKWDLEGLKGATERQLLHPHYHLVKKYLFKNFKPTNDVALVMLCSIKKPYFDNSILKNWIKLSSKNNADLFIVSNPGIIPINFSNHYPFRFYEWPEEEETKEIKEKYEEVTKDRIEEWFNVFNNYKKVIGVIREGESQIAFDKAILKQKKVNLLKKYNKLIREKYEKRFEGYAGWEKSRILHLTLVKELFIKEIKKI